MGMPLLLYMKLKFTRHRKLNPKYALNGKTESEWQAALTLSSAYLSDKHIIRVPTSIHPTVLSLSLRRPAECIHKRNKNDNSLI